MQARSRNESNSPQAFLPAPDYVVVASLWHVLAGDVLLFSSASHRQSATRNTTSNDGPMNECHD
jgi:hypothetical protein